jgi:hypothetical protein
MKFGMAVIIKIFLESLFSGVPASQLSVEPRLRCNKCLTTFPMLKTSASYTTSRLALNYTVFRGRWKMEAKGVELDHQSLKQNL